MWTVKEGSISNLFRERMMVPSKFGWRPSYLSRSVSSLPPTGKTPEKITQCRLIFLMRLWILATFSFVISNCLILVSMELTCTTMSDERVLAFCWCIELLRASSLRRASKSGALAPEMHNTVVGFLISKLLMPTRLVGLLQLLCQPHLPH